MLVVLSGLPGVGKTTIAKALAKKRSATYVRIDEIEQALRQYPPFTDEIGGVGYVVAFAVASSNLRLGNMVVADSVNPVAESREGWRKVASGVGPAGLLEVEIICSDQNEHRRRIESRTADIDGLSLPSWSSVMAREYTPRSAPRLVIDTADHSVEEAISAIERRLDALEGDCLPAD